MSHERCTSGGGPSRVGSVRFGLIRFVARVGESATRERRSANDDDGFDDDDDGFDDDDDPARVLDVVSDDGRARGERERGRCRDARDDDRARGATGNESRGGDVRGNAPRRRARLPARHPARVRGGTNDERRTTNDERRNDEMSVFVPSRRAFRHDTD